MPYRKQHFYYAVNFGLSFTTTVQTRTRTRVTGVISFQGSAVARKLFISNEERPKRR